LTKIRQERCGGSLTKDKSPPCGKKSESDNVERKGESSSQGHPIEEPRRAEDRTVCGVIGLFPS